MKRIAHELDTMAGKWLDEHRGKKNSEECDEEKDFMDVMISAVETGGLAEYDADTVIKSTCMVLIASSPDTTTVMRPKLMLAIVHSLHLSSMQILEWKSWEKDILQQQATAHDPSRFRLTKESSFVKGHATRSGLPIIFYVICFFRQFFTSVGRSDYLTMHHGFISVHLAPGSQFNFQNYIKRSLEDDFKLIVGISLWNEWMLLRRINLNRFLLF